jgi:hypothetical protein
MDRPSPRPSAEFAALPGAAHRLGEYAATPSEINYGVSSGDDAIAEPYAYVGPWILRTGDFWNAPFGATRLMTDLPDATAVLAFFRTGQQQAAMG